MTKIIKKQIDSKENKKMSEESKVIKKDLISEKVREHIINNDHLNNLKTITYKGVVYDIIYHERMIDLVDLWRKNDIYDDDQTIILREKK